MATTTTFSYRDATFFPVIPRTNGIAKLSAGAAQAPSSDVTLVTFHSAEDMKTLAKNPIEAADLEKEAVFVEYKDNQRVLHVAAGKKITLDSVRKAVNGAVAKAKALKATKVEFVVPAVAAATTAQVAEVVLQTAALSNYHFDRYLTTEAKVPSLLEAIHVSAASGEDLSESVTRARVLAEATIFARDLGNERADEMHPARVEEVARALAAEAGMAVTVVAGEDLIKENMHLAYAVGQAARHAPRYIELVHKGDPEHPDDVILLVGKGVTFDSGGLNIKGTGFMEEMHMDMCGAAAVLGCAFAASKLAVKRNVVFVVGAVENATDAMSYKPHNIIRSHKGLTVEIGNTDAEGRLVLADALSFAQQRHKPHTIVDMATLTGACVIALGEYAAGLFTNNKSLSSSLINAGEAWGERAWPLPIFQEHRDELTGTPFADLKSTGEGRYGGSCTAAAFLENFIGHAPAKNARKPTEEAAESVKPAWAHIDIAGPAMYSRDRGHMKKGSTGFGVHLVTQYLLTAPAGPLPADA